MIALFGIYQGWFRYGFWENNGPGSGFIPVIACVLLAIFTLSIFMKDIKQPSVLNKKQLYPIVGGGILLLLSIQVVGMILSIAVFMIVWLFAIEKSPILRASIYGLTTTAVIYIIFKVALEVPLPEGLIGI